METRPSWARTYSRLSIFGFFKLQYLGREGQGRKKLLVGMWRKLPHRSA
jgi:hypothetical protein